MYQAGWSKAEIRLTPKGYAMHGFGQWQHRAYGQQSPLYARAILIRDGHSKKDHSQKGDTPTNHAPENVQDAAQNTCFKDPTNKMPDACSPLIFCCMDLGYITRIMRAHIVARLTARLPAFDRQRLVLTCTHTHSGPGGCSQDGLYNVVTPGFVPAHVTAIVTAACDAIEAAASYLQPVTISLHSGQFDAATEVAWNRSLSAYNRNPDVVPRAPHDTHLAINRAMQVLRLARNNTTQALISLFGVHATCCGNMLDKYSSDNKGAAASLTEARLLDAGADTPVAIFAQATAGDVSPFYHGPGDRARRAAIKGDAHYAYAQANGLKQSDAAMAIIDTAGKPLDGPVDGVLTYADFTNVEADPTFSNGHTDARTSEPCHGVAFFTGTPIDGPGMPPLLGRAAKLLARRLKHKRLARPHAMDADDRDHYQRLYAAQGVKDILLESGHHKQVLGHALASIPLPGFSDPLVRELKRQASSGALDHSDMVPSVLPLQIIRLGGVALVCCPGEFTTTAGRRVVACVQERLDAQDIEVLITTYCNDYMGYVTTQEEYQQQNYEGGHTVFGQWTLAAFQTRLAALAHTLMRPPLQRRHDCDTLPTPAPADELAKRSNLTPPPR